MSDELKKFRQACEVELARLTEGEAGWRVEISIVDVDDGPTWRVYVQAPKRAAYPGALATTAGQMQLVSVSQITKTTAADVVGSLVHKLRTDP